MRNQIQLRDVVEGDLDILFAQQMDLDANQMAAFAARDREAFMLHWAKILKDTSIIKKTIFIGEQVAGNIVCFESLGKREIGYWLGRSFWNKGLATIALKTFLIEIKVRPVFACVAKHNLASIRVLEKCGFIIVGEEKEFSKFEQKTIEGFVLKLG